MRIVYHLGAHCTDDERLLRCLLKNRGALAAQGIVVPGPTRYRNLMRDTAIALKGQTASLDTQALVLEQIIEGNVAERLILSWENFLSFAPWAVDGALYPSAGDRTRAHAGLSADRGRVSSGDPQPRQLFARRLCQANGLEGRHREV